MNYRSLIVVAVVLILAVSVPQECDAISKSQLRTMNTKMQEDEAALKALTMKLEEEAMLRAATDAKDQDPRLGVRCLIETEYIKSGNPCNYVDTNKDDYHLYLEDCHLEHSNGKVQNEKIETAQTFLYKIRYYDTSNPSYWRHLTKDGNFCCIYPSANSVLLKCHQVKDIPTDAKPSDAKFKKGSRSDWNMAKFVTDKQNEVSKVSEKQLQLTDLEMKTDCQDYLNSITTMVNEAKDRSNPTLKVEKIVLALHHKMIEEATEQSVIMDHFNKGDLLMKKTLIRLVYRLMSLFRVDSKSLTEIFTLAWQTGIENEGKRKKAAELIIKERLRDMELSATYFGIKDQKERINFKRSLISKKKLEFQKKVQSVDSNKKPVPGSELDRHLKLEADEATLKKNYALWKKLIESLGEEQKKRVTTFLFDSDKVPDYDHTVRKELRSVNCPSIDFMMTFEEEGFKKHNEKNQFVASVVKAGFSVASGLVSFAPMGGKAAGQAIQIIGDFVLSVINKINSIKALRRQLRASWISAYRSALVDENGNYHTSDICIAQTINLLRIATWFIFKTEDQLNTQVFTKMKSCIDMRDADGIEKYTPLLSVISQTIDTHFKTSDFTSIPSLLDAAVESVEKSGEFFKSLKEDLDDIEEAKKKQEEEDEKKDNEDTDKEKQKK